MKLARELGDCEPAAVGMVERAFDSSRGPAFNLAVDAAWAVARTIDPVNVDPSDVDPVDPVARAAKWVREAIRAVCRASGLAAARKAVEALPAKLAAQHG